jgi:hypothetical protein
MKFWKNTKITGSYLNPYFRSSIYWMITFIIPLCINTATLNAQEKTAKTISELAISYLKKIANGDLDITKDTALSSNCSSSRRIKIREHLTFIQLNYFRKNDTFSLELLEQGEQFSAVLIRVENTATPLDTRIISVAMAREKDGWKPAPLPNSFTNINYGYDESVEKKIKHLEKWMTTEKTKREIAIREKATSKFQSLLAKNEKELQPNKLDAGTAVLKFIDACQHNNLMKALVSMGAASDALDNPLDDTVNVVSNGLETRDTNNKWQLLTNSSSIYNIMNIDNKRNEVAVGFYNPLMRTSSQVLYFPIKEKGQKTFVRLSPSLEAAVKPNKNQRQRHFHHRRDDEQKLIRKIPSVIFKNIETKHAKSPEKLVEDFLGATNFKDAVALLPTKELPIPSEDGQIALLESLAFLWQGFNSVRSLPKPSIKIARDGLLAAAPLEYAQPKKLGAFQTWRLWMIKGDKGWHLIPEKSIAAIVDEKIKLKIKGLSEKLAIITKNQHKELIKKVLSHVTKIDLVELKEAVTKQEAINLFKLYRSRLRSNDYAAALDCCALLDNSSDTRTLKNFNYAIRGASDHTKDDLILGVVKSGKWSGVSVRTQSKTSGTHDYPMYLFLNTNNGAKILLDIDLRYPSNKGRSIINKKNWDKIEKNFPNDSLKRVETIFVAHEKITLKNIQEEKKIHE